jgi:Ca2+-binding RTX toxin-like protein
MKRALLLVAMMMLTVVAATGVALAATSNCGSASQNPRTPQCYGTDQDDQIEGRTSRDIIYANDGDDEVNAQYGGDEVYGEAGRDKIEGGGKGPPTGPYEDLDKLYGGSSNDVFKDIRASRDFDELRGGGGNDRLNATDTDTVDILVCGPGTDDTAIFDVNQFSGKRDSVSPSCENKDPVVN